MEWRNKGNTPSKEYQGHVLGGRLRELIRGHVETIGSYLLDKSRLILVLLDRAGDILDANEAFKEILGPQDHWLGKPLRDFLLRESNSALHTLMKGKGEGELRLNVDSGTFGIITLSCKTYLLKDNYLIIAERPLPSTNDLIKNLAGLTQELTNLSRDLAQKNKKLLKANRTITQLMRTDPLTGLANRRFLLETLTPAIAAAKRHSSPLSVVMADLDHFKAINDTYGHDVGDQVLKGFAKVLISNARTEDLPGRWGGEEFLTILPYTDREGARLFAERIRKDLSKQGIPGTAAVLTASFGVAQLGQGETLDGLIKRADQALYKAKEAGRDRVVVDLADL